MRQLSTLAALALLVFPVAAAAQPKGVPGAGKTPGACNAKVLPLVVGNTWTYSQVQAPMQLPENMARLAPLPAKDIVITVTAVDTKGTETVAKLEEKISYDISRDPKVPKIVDRTINSTITCNTRGKFDISPESFFFAGEPGAFWGLEFDKLERKKETSWKLTNGTIGEAEWIEEIAAHWNRVPTKGSDAKLGGGKLELERKFTPQPTERIATKMGNFMNAEKLGLTTTGRVLLDNKTSPDGKPCATKKPDPAKKGEEITVYQEACELPANWINQLWIVAAVGVVQVLNSYAHQYQLVAATLK